MIQAATDNMLEDSVAKVLKLMLKLSQDGFYGKIVLQFEDGKIKLVRQETTSKPEDL
jgi:hypothetical protein